jgi:hypothetical protein
MAKKKGVRIIVTLECTEARGLGETPSRYCTQKVIGLGWAELAERGWGCSSSSSSSNSSSSSDSGGTGSRDAALSF